MRFHTIWLFKPLPTDSTLAWLFASVRHPLSFSIPRMCKILFTKIRLIFILSGRLIAIIFERFRDILYWTRWDAIDAIIGQQTFTWFQFDGCRLHVYFLLYLMSTSLCLPQFSHFILPSKRTNDTMKPLEKCSLLTTSNFCSTSATASSAK